MFLKHLKPIINSSSVRLIFLYSALYIGSSLILLAFIFWFSVVYIQQQMDHHIEFDRKTLISIYKQFGRDKMVESIHERFMNENYDSIYLLYDKSNNILSGNLEKIPANIHLGWQEISLESCMCVKNEHSNTARVFTEMLDDDLYLLNGLDINSSASLKKQLFTIMLFGLIMILMLGMAGGFIVSRNTIRKINIMNATILAIQKGNLDLRIPYDSSDTDYDLLAENINNMLDQIKLLIINIQNISNHISHDLRTPLTRMRGKLENVLSTANHQQADNILDAIDEADTLLSAFNAILRISKLESGAAKSNFTDLSLNKLIEDVVEFYEPLANDQQLQITMQLNSQAIIYGDRDMLFQAIANILDNSIKYSNNAGKIDISIIKENTNVILHIADNGHGIPEHERENVFERFFQLSKHRGSQGHGLGLSLVAAITKLHKASIQLSDNSPGLIVSITFPQKT
ncbi:MAG: HAMP domain-containing sensor histidine kinase [Pseudomonadota bacterium]